MIPLFCTNFYVSCESVEVLDIKPEYKGPSVSDYLYDQLADII